LTSSSQLPLGGLNAFRLAGGVEFFGCCSFLPFFAAGVELVEVRPRFFGCLVAARASSWTNWRPPIEL